MRLPALLIALLLLALPGRADEVPRVPLRVGTHPDHGRLVFDWPSRVGYGVEEQDGRLVIRFEAPGRIDLAAARHPPRNVLAIEQEGAAIALRIAPGARPRHFRLGNRIVIDLRNPAAEPVIQRTPRPPEPIAVAAPPMPAAALPLPPPATIAAVTPPVPRPEPPAAPAPMAPPAAVERPAALPMPGAMPMRLLPGTAAIAFDAGAAAGLAVFRRGEWLHIVLDRAVTPDLSALRGHAVFGLLEALPAGEGTAFRLRLAAPARLAPRRDGDAWVLEATPRAAPAETQALRPVPDAGPPARLLLEGGHPGSSVTIADPATGETILIGTLRQPGPAVLLARRLPEFDLLPTILGAAIVARSDRLRLRIMTGDRLALEAATGEPLGLGAPPGQEPPPAAIAMSRLLDLPSGPVPVLLERLRSVLSSVNMARRSPAIRGGAMRRRRCSPSACRRKRRRWRASPSRKIRRRGRMRGCCSPMASRRCWPAGPAMRAASTIRACRRATR